MEVRVDATGAAVRPLIGMARAGRCRGCRRLRSFGDAPALTDFARLAVQVFRRNPNLETAFLAGYGIDPREAGAWHRTRVRGEAIATAVWPTE